MSHIQVVKDFNELLEVLIQQIGPLTGNNSYHKLFKTLVKCNAILPINKFNEYAIDWSTQIESKDESFFLSSKNIEENIHEDEDKDDELLNRIFQLQNVWTTLDKESKDNLWEMIQALLTLGKKYKEIKG